MVKSTALLAAVCWLSGCSDAIEERFATAVATSALQAPQQGGAGREVVDSVRDTCAADPDAAASDAAAHPIVGLYPSSCAVKTADGPGLHVELAGCTGVFGKVELDGGVDALFSPAEGCALHADLADSGDLTANGRPLDYAAAADITLGDGMRAVEWSADWTGTTRRGLAITQHTDLHVELDDATGCLAATGAAHGATSRFEYALELDGLALCPGACPSAGTVHAELDGPLRDRAIRVDFDGSAVAHVTGWSGRRFDVPLVCDEAEAEAEP
ncbi:MAG: hypothetical protein HY908_24545 [Myxococcales bacterium]|nr:hypothetical protein [Myxococcales bacterium]